MPGHDIIVIGASAGGLQSLKDLVKDFPREMKASIFVVLHTGAGSGGFLPRILRRSGKLPAQYATDGLSISPGHIYVAPGDYHMLLDEGRIRVTHGPKENRARPAVDPLFRSAAWTYGPRVIGVILSGMLDDGVAGLWAVKTCGGISIVQHPDEAQFPDMPLNALQYVKVDHTLRVSSMSRLITKLVEQPVTKKRRIRPPERLKLESDFAMMRGSIKDMKKLGRPSPFACPTCHGVMWELKEGSMVRYRCHTGHAFNAESLLAEQSESVEEALYEALQAMEEKSVVLRRLAMQFGGNSPGVRSEYEAKAAMQDKKARIIRKHLAKRGP